MTKHKYPYAELVRQMRLSEPSADHIFRMQWERDVRAVAAAIEKESAGRFDPEHFCHCLGMQYDPRAGQSAITTHTKE